MQEKKKNLKFLVLKNCVLYLEGWKILRVSSSQKNQCCGSGSESGSVFFGPPGSGSGSISHKYGSESGSVSFYHHAKIVRKTLIPTVLWLLFDFLSLKNDVNIPYLQKVISRKTSIKKKLFFVGVLKVNDENSRVLIQDPDPLVRGMDPRIRIRIHTKMSWIRNTGKNKAIFSNDFFSLQI